MMRNGVLALGSSRTIGWVRLKTLVSGLHEHSHLMDPKEHHHLWLRQPTNTLRS
jgi:hypothetical protein